MSNNNIIRIAYAAPEARTVETRSECVLCTSGWGTEKVTVGTEVYDENDWE